MIVWDLAAGRQVSAFACDYPSICCAVCNDGTTFICGDEGGALHFFCVLRFAKSIRIADATNFHHISPPRIRAVFPLCGESVSAGGTGELQKRSYQLARRNNLGLESDKLPSYREPKTPQDGFLNCLSRLTNLPQLKAKLRSKKN